MSLSSAYLSAQQNNTATGIVLDSRGEVLIGVTVVLKDFKNIYTMTDKEGRFSLSLPDSINRPILIFSYVGTTPQEVEYKGKPLEIILHFGMLDEVVITGIFTKPKESFTGAANRVTSEELSMSGSRSVVSSLRNLDPSFNIADNLSFGSDPNRLPAVTIRGSTSISKEYREIGGEAANLNEANQPLFILDGFEISLERFIDLDETTISSITLLKDASSTAIYGSRGSNGVVIITSVQPEPGKLKLSYSADLSVEAPSLSSYNLMNAREKLEFEKLSGLYNSNNPIDQASFDQIYNNRKLDAERGVDTYWLKYPVRTGVNLNHSMAVSGGDPLFQYSARISYRQHKGVMKGSQRGTLNNSLFLSYHFKKISVTNNLIVSSTKSKNSPYGKFSDYAGQNPYLKPYADNGVVVKILEAGNKLNLGEKIYNPLYNALLPLKDETKSTYISENLSIEYKPIANLRLTARFNITHTNIQGNKFLPYKHTSFDNLTEDQLQEKGSYTYSPGESSSYSGDLTAQYSLILKKHLLNFGFSYNISDSKTEQYSIKAVGLTTEKADYLGMASSYGPGRPNSSDKKQRRVGGIFTFNYTFDRRLFFDFSAVAEGSSQFGVNQRFAPFWSTGIGWNLHHEKFLKSWVDKDYLNSLRLRLSYGSTGSQGFESYQSVITYNSLEGKGYHQHYGVQLQGLGNPDLKWQKTNQVNAGFEFRIIDDLLQFNFDYYSKSTNNLLTEIYLPISSGFEYYLANIGKLRNQGYQLSLYISPLRSSAPKGLSVNVGFSAIHNSNKVIKISNSVDFMNDKIKEKTRVNPSFMYKEGESMNTIFAVKSMGIDPSNGKELFVRRDGTLTYAWDSNDLVPCGVTDPTMTGNISLNVRYGNFTLSSIFGYTFGGKNYNYTLVNKVENVNPQTNADKRVLYERWRQPGDQVRFKGFENKENTNATSRFIMEDNSLELRNLSLGYRITSKWLEKNLQIKTLLLRANTEDIFRIASIKQERGISYPYSKKYSFSLTATF